MTPRHNISARSRFDERSFSLAGPSAWNALPSDIRAVGDMKVFRQAVKTRFLSLAFRVILIVLLADRTNGRAYATVLRLSSVCRLYGMYCG